MDPVRLALGCLRLESIVIVAAVYLVAFLITKMAEQKVPVSQVGDIAFPLTFLLCSVYVVHFLANLATYSGPEIGQSLAFVTITLLWSSLLTLALRVSRLFSVEARPDNAR